MHVHVQPICLRERLLDLSIEACGRGGIDLCLLISFTERGKKYCQGSGKEDKSWCLQAHWLAIFSTSVIRPIIEVVLLSTVLLAVLIVTGTNFYCSGSYPDHPL